MRFYYISIISIFLLLVIWFIGTGLLAWFGAWLRKRMKHAWVVMVPLFLLLYIGPVAEELLISRNFGQLCKKDAGIFIYKTVEVDGFYDDTAHWWRQLTESKYRFVESREHGTNRMWRVERDGKELRHFELAQPTARYHYTKDSGALIHHKVYLQTSQVLDSHSNDVIARYNRYSRRAPWFFVGLDKPGFGCDGPDGGPYTKHSFLIYRDVLVPANLKREQIK